MTPLSLAALLALGADPYPAYSVPPLPSAPCTPAVGPRLKPPTPAGPTPLFDRLEARQKDPPVLAIDGAVPPPPGSFLWQPRFRIDWELVGPARPYAPQPGDIMLATDTSVFWVLAHNLAGTSHPTHSGVVFCRPDGTLGILEGGPHDTLHCRVLDALPHLGSYEAEGRVWVRRRSCPLTPEQSARLTEFALASDGKRFALGRLGVQLTPFRTRGPVRTAFVGKAYGDRDSYFCSELVIEALVYAGLLDPRTARPSATYPRDIFFGASPNPYINKHLTMCGWEPPARWTSLPVPVQTGDPGKERGIRRR
jgi:hypothetical protein